MQERGARKTRILIGEANPFTSSGIRVTLNAIEDLILIGEATNEQEIQHLFQDLQPDVSLVADPYQPEFRLDIRIVDGKGTAGGSYEFCAWDGTEWQNLALPGGAAIQNGSPSVIEIQIPKHLLGNPEFVNLGVASTGRERVHTAGDILGTAVSPVDWAEPVILDVFGQYVIKNSP
jgi:hypothetical protein